MSCTFWSLSCRSLGKTFKLYVRFSHIRCKTSSSRQQANFLNCQQSKSLQCARNSTIFNTFRLFSSDSKENEIPYETSDFDLDADSSSLLELFLRLNAGDIEESAFYRSIMNKQKWYVPSDTLDPAAPRGSIRIYITDDGEEEVLLFSNEVSWIAASQILKPKLSASSYLILPGWNMFLGLGRLINSSDNKLRRVIFDAGTSLQVVLENNMVTDLVRWAEIVGIEKYLTLLSEFKDDDDIPSLSPLLESKFFLMKERRNNRKTKSHAGPESVEEEVRLLILTPDDGEHSGKSLAVVFTSLDLAANMLAASNLVNPANVEIHKVVGATLFPSLLLDKQDSIDGIIFNCMDGEGRQVIVDRNFLNLVIEQKKV